MARKTEAGRTLDEMQHAGDRLAEWLDRNAVIVLGAVLTLLALVGVAIFISSRRDSAEERAADALADVRAEYRTAMGASPDDLTVPEPANPETARRVRTEYVTRFAELAREHAGTTAAAFARLEEGTLQQQLGERDEALETWTEGKEALAADDPVRAFFLRRIGAMHEAEGDWAAAARAYEEASGIQGYPLRYAALADAARCWAEAGDDAKAIAAFERIESEAPDFRVPPYVASRIRELRARRELAAGGDADRAPEPAPTDG